MFDPKIRIRASDDTGPAFRSANNNLRELQESAATIGASLGGALGAAGIAALVTGWQFKFVLITRAARA